MSSDMTVAKENLPTSVAAELEAELAGLNKKIGGGSSNRIKTTGKKFTFPDAQDDKLAGPIPVIILGWITEHVYYGGGVFDDKNPTPPVCWALGDNPKELIPSDNATDKQADACNVCPMNEWESGIGKSKACKNTRKLAVIRADDVEAQNVFTLSVSPTGLKEFDGFVRKLGQKHALPVMVITELSFDDDKTYPSLKFRAADPNPNVETHWTWREEAQAQLMIEPDPSEFQQTERTNRAPTVAKEGGRSAGSRKI